MRRYPARRETSFSSAPSSRASTPPSSHYLASPQPRANTPQQLLLWLLSTSPSLATLLHYLSLLLSLRLVVVNPRWTTLLLCLCLAMTLEGRAKAERLGLRNTMGGIMTVVGSGVVWKTIVEVGGRSDRAVSEPCSQRQLLNASTNAETEGPLDVAIAICAEASNLTPPDHLADELLCKATSWLEGKPTPRGATLADDLCRVVSEALPRSNRLTVDIAARPRMPNESRAIDLTVAC